VLKQPALVAQTSAIRQNKLHRAPKSGAIQKTTGPSLTSNKVETQQEAYQIKSKKPAMQM
jgi:hypothetical protein